MKKLLILISIIVIGNQYSCKPEPTPSVDPVFTALPKDIKDYCVFKYGSFWIYQDSVSGVLDTVTVSSYAIDTVDYPKIDGKLVGTNETFKMKLYHSYDGFTDEIRPFTNPPPPPYPNNNTFNIYIWRSKQTTFLGETVFQIFPYQVGKSYIPNNDTVKLISISDSFIHYHNGFHPGYDRSAVETYHKRNIGVVRKEVKKANQVWKLIDFHINQ